MVGVFGRRDTQNGLHKFKILQGILFFSLSFLFINSCKKDIYISIPEEPPQLVVNCLFNSDSVWKVFVGKTMSPKDTLLQSIVEQAEVTLMEGDQSFPLAYWGDGYYGINKKPVEGVDYTLKVSAPGFQSVEARSRLPNRLTLSDYSFDTIPFSYVSLAQGEIQATQLSLSMEEFDEKSYSQVSVFQYSKSELFYFTITDKTLDSIAIKAKEAPPYTSEIDLNDYLHRVSLLKDKPILSRTSLLEKLDEVFPKNFPYYYKEIILTYTHRTPTQKYYEKAFVPIPIVGAQPPFYKIDDKDDVYTAFGQGVKQAPTKEYLFFMEARYFARSELPDSIRQKRKAGNEVWVDFSSLSKEVYEFKTSFVKQTVHANNPLADPVQVYSNVKGGTGIFGGYRKQRIRIY